MSSVNRLSQEKSPYLLQHAQNPVDWYPWGEEAFAQARAKQRPIFLSIGYSTCHWCHVMERESFENPDIAAVMNRHFINIKVDREERPDVDKVYMTALQAMGENGGWPMSMFLTPDLKPFYGGTYFPPTSRYGRIGFPDLLERIHHIWTNERDRVLESANGITDWLRQVPAATTPSGMPEKSALDQCYTQAAKSYDPQFGGFGGGPKFPRPSVFNFLLRYYHTYHEQHALDMSDKTLRAMASGGMYDHLGGGFHRYSVDGEWRVPHFEKMLYDQAQIVCSMADMYQISRHPFYARIIRETLGYVMRDMTHPEGGFYSAEDADSTIPESPHEKREGAFYVWTKQELEQILGDDARAFTFYFGVETEGNALHDPQMEFAGKNILYVANGLKESAAFAGISEEEMAKLIERAKERLFEVRKSRPRPHLDDKVLAAWNGLMISAFARAAQVLDEPEFAYAAARSADFILAHLYDESSGNLSRRYREGASGLEAHLDDYAFVAQGLLDLYEADFNPERLHMAARLMEKAATLFWDESWGGFFDTSGKDASILVRMKEQYDGAEPTGNAVAVMNLLRLAHITGDGALRDRAEKCFSAFGDVLKKAPFAMPQMAAALTFALSKVRQIVIAGESSDPRVRAMVEAIHSHYDPNKVLLVTNGKPEMMGEFAKSLQMIDGKPAAYVCEDFVCRLPTTDVNELKKLLAG